jgi:hypothetical protein
MSKREYLPMSTSSVGSRASSVMSKTMRMLSASEEMVFVIVGERGPAK